MYSALDVSTYIIARYSFLSTTVSNLKLQKLLYYLQAEFLVRSKNDKACFSQPIYAVDWGPVVWDVWNDYKTFNNSYIPCFEDMRKNYTQIIDRKHRKIVDEILLKYKDISNTTMLDDIYHQSPWIDAYKNGNNTEISNQSLFEYFNSINK